MLVTQEDFRDYAHFAEGVAAKLGFKSKLPDVIWHYTSAPGLLGILESGSLYATQLACLNDQSEIRYAVFQFRSALQKLRSKPGDDPNKDYVFELVDRTADFDGAPNSELYVTCFSKAADDLSQWRAYGGGENGYAFAFNAEALYSHHSVIAPVCYDTELHIEVAGEIAAAFLEFFVRGLRKGFDRQQWTQDFGTSWDNAIRKVSAMVKHSAFRSEEEYRCIHKLEPTDHSRLEFRQKAGMLTRHLPLFFPPPGRPRDKILPILEVMIGPCRHPTVSKGTVELLLAKSGYGGVLVTNSRAPFQAT